MVNFEKENKHLYQLCKWECCRTSHIETLFHYSSKNLEQNVLVTWVPISALLWSLTNDGCWEDELYLSGQDDKQRQTSLGNGCSTEAERMPRDPGDMGLHPTSWCFFLFVFCQQCVLKKDPLGGAALLIFGDRRLLWRIFLWIFLSESQFSEMIFSE